MISEKVVQAYILAQELHKGQFRRFSGFEYFVHPKAVSRMALDLTKDQNLVIAGLLHDTIEDTNITKEQIELQFGKVVADIVDELTTKSYDKENIEKKVMMLEKMTHMSNDAFTLKLMDRLDNVSWMDKDCKTIDQQAFVKKSFIETTFILNGLQYARKNKTSLQKALIRMIEAKLSYIKIKHLW